MAKLPQTPSITSATVHEPAPAQPLNSDSKSAKWHWHPDLPLQGVPYWSWPPRPIAVLKWLTTNFLQVTDRAFFLVAAFVVAYWLQPVSETQALMSINWVGWAIIRNFVLLLVVAGGLHMWFYGIDAQGNLLKYDPRPISKRRSKVFTFGYQTWDNMFFTLVFAAPIATGYEVMARWMYANGQFMVIDFSDNMIWFVLMFPLLTMFQGLHFYVVHRMLHWPLIYKQIHSIHHRNINPGPWSGLSMHPIELVLYFSSLLIFFLVPSHPVHMLFLLYWQLLGAPSGHSGYEAVWAKDKARLAVGGFFHQLHHRYFECNYGNQEFPLDKLFNTHHDGSEEATLIMRKRISRMHQK